MVKCGSEEELRADWQQRPNGTLHPKPKRRER